MKKIIICIFVICINHQAFSKPPRPIFQRMKVKVNNIIIDVEVADTLEEQSYGLMYIEKPLKEIESSFLIISTHLIALDKNFEIRRKHNLAVVNSF